MNKKFRVLFTDAKTGYDLYDGCYFYAPSLAELAVRLDNKGVSFRLVEDVTKNFAGAEYTFGNLNTIIPARAFRNPQLA